MEPIICSYYSQKGVARAGCLVWEGANQASNASCSTGVCTDLHTLGPEHDISAAQLQSIDPVHCFNSISQTRFRICPAVQFQGTCRGTRMFFAGPQSAREGHSHAGLTSTWVQPNVS